MDKIERIEKEIEKLRVEVIEKVAEIKEAINPKIAEHEVRIKNLERYRNGSGERERLEYYKFWVIAVIIISIANLILAIMK